MTPAERQTQLTEFLALPAETEWVEFPLCVLATWRENCLSQRRQGSKEWQPRMQDLLTGKVRVKVDECEEAFAHA